MHLLLRLAYAAAGGGASLLARVAPSTDGKLARSFAIRRGAVEGWEAWARAHRVAARPLLWMHAPSVGEGLQARPVLELVRSRLPDVQLAYSYFSPSAERFARTLPVDVAKVLPFDTDSSARRLLAALRPSALVFSKLDVWPVLAHRAARAGIPLGLVSGTISEGSSRSSRAARALLGDAYRELQAVGAVSDEDARRLVSLGVRQDATVVTGDTRFDQVWERAARVDRTSALLAPFADARSTLVAGSTWPSDESVLLAAWPQIRSRVPDARLVIAPHEPTPQHLAPIERWAEHAGQRLARLGSEGAAAADVVLVDRVGVLGDLYALATAAFVGGGFHAAGLHSVLEPAAFGAPVAFGPNGLASRDARLLQAHGGGVMVSDVDEVVRVFADWLGNTAGAAAAGAHARSVVQGGLGAAERSYRLVVGLLNHP